MMVALLLSAYCTGGTSSRKIERKTQEDALYGKGKRGDELPAELRRAQTRLQRM
ncbi:hypothetical protein D7X55_00805 [Corallococcus sp. AB049A]|nr:hypothetical protein D7Y23_13025 [Corallococcus sp. AB050B]RKI75004.1 hypothetical protein D7X55_00805 [Corallococcus sp. AB049A]